VYQEVLERLLCLAAVGYIYLILTAAVTALQRYCRLWIVLHRQTVRAYGESADSCRERAATWTKRSMSEPDAQARADFARKAAGFACRAEANEAGFKHYQLEVLCWKFLE
jgi:hypothetical protein